MKKPSCRASHLLAGLAGLAAMALPLGASAALIYDVNVTNHVIFGSGNANGGFTVDRANNVELGLRAKVRYDVITGGPLNVYNSHGDGSYHHAVGGAGPGGARARWNFEWSINADLSGTQGRDLADLSYVFKLDFNPGIATSFQAFDPINVACWDHAMGSNTTTAANDVSVPGCSPTVSTLAQQAAYGTLIGTNNLAQNSWNLEFFDTGNFFDPGADGQYTFVLEAFDPTGQRLASTQIDVIVGAGPQDLPLPGTLALVGLALAGAGGIRRSRRRIA